MHSKAEAATRFWMFRARRFIEEGLTQENS
jgi:hypothetical protein